MNGWISDIISLLMSESMKQVECWTHVKRRISPNWQGKRGGEGKMGE